MKQTQKNKHSKRNNLRLMLFSIALVMMNGIGVAEDNVIFEDDELEQLIQDQWEDLVGDENTQSSAAPILKHDKSKQVPAVTRDRKEQPSESDTSFIDEEDISDQEVSSQIEEESGESGKVKFTKLMEDLNKDTLLTPIQIDPYKLQYFENLVIQNRGLVSGFLGAEQNKKGDYKLRIIGLDEASVSDRSNLFGVENSKLFIKIRHKKFDRLLGYYQHKFDSVIINRKKVGLKRSFEAGMTFWSRWSLVPVLGEEWYLLQAYYDPDKCLAIKENKDLKVKTCKITEQDQHWRFGVKNGSGETRKRDLDLPIL